MIHLTWYIMTIPSTTLSPRVANTLIATSISYYLVVYQIIMLTPLYFQFFSIGAYPFNDCVIYYGECHKHFYILIDTADC